MKTKLKSDSPLRAATCSPSSLWALLDAADDLLNTGDVLLDGWPAAREWHEKYQSLTVSNPVIEPGHPEAVCEDCHGPNVVWFAPSALWNRVCRPEGYERDPMLCPRCFAVRAAHAGVDEVWQLIPENTKDTAQ